MERTFHVKYILSNLGYCVV